MKKISLFPVSKPPLRSSLFAVLGGCLLVACGGPPRLDDDEGAPQPSNAAADHLSLPYATGTKVRIKLFGNSSGPSTGWSLVSDQPSVFAIDKLSKSDDTHVAADCTALTSGQATLRMLDEQGTERHTAAITVTTADRVRILGHGLLRTVEDSAKGAVSEDIAAVSEVREARVLNGSTGVFGLVYYRGSERVYGHGMIQFDAITQVPAENKTTGGAPVTEWLFFKPLSVGNYSLALRQQSGPFAALPVVVVPESEITSLSLVPASLQDPKKDQMVWVYARARDANSRDIYGAYASFTLAGMPQKSNSTPGDTTGDLYRYTYAPGASSELVASRGTLRATLTVPAQTGSIYNTTYLGCSFAGSPARSTTPLAAWISLGLLGLGLLNRRLRRSLRAA